MIQSIEIENYKSIFQLDFHPGRVTVLIGENGCGKSNILEAIALASAAANDKLDNEFLASRGIRVTEPKFMRSAFSKENIDKEIKITVNNDRKNLTYNCIIQNENKSYSRWDNSASMIKYPELGLGKNIQDKKLLDETSIIRDMMNQKNNETSYSGLYDYVQEMNRKASKILETDTFPHFLIFSPQYHILRTFAKEGQIQPLGINGEGLFKYIKYLMLEKPEKINEIKEYLRLIDWFEDLDIPDNLFSVERTLQIKDRYLDNDIAYFSQNSSNEGFLYLLFYFSLFTSDLSPNFLAIDNIDISFNPKLCSRLITELTRIAKKYNKQVILTTHSPAVLDGLNLDDEEQKLFIVYRNKMGHTKLKKVNKPEPVEGIEPVKLSESFLRGYIGGLPKSF